MGDLVSRPARGVNLGMNEVRAGLKARAFLTLAPERLVDFILEHVLLTDPEKDANRCKMRKTKFCRKD
jgi:hypothetical protein